MAKPKDTAYLEQHGPSWRVRLKVPDRLREIVGASKLVIALHTDSLAIANRDKHKHIHALKQRLAAAEAELRRHSKKPMDPLVEEALVWRDSLKQGEAEDLEEGEMSNAEWALGARLEELERSVGEDRAGVLATLAYGRATALSPFADDWLEAKPMKPRQKLDYRRAVSKLETWLRDKELAPTVEAITKRIASDYRDEVFLKAGVHPRTANKDLSALSGFWKHAERKALVEDNPWRGQYLPEASATQGAHKRPLTDAELATLLASEHASPLLCDAISRPAICPAFP